MTTDMTQAYEWRGRTVVDRDGDKIGKLDEIYLDQRTDQPEWALVKTGPFGTRSTFVPLAGAAPAGASVQVDWDKSQVKDAPTIDADGELSQEDEAQLYRHYGLSYSDGTRGSGRSTGRVQQRVRLGKDVVTDEREVSEEVRKERIDAEGDVDG
ncbi:MAG: PRC-barrel domain-containing protein [Thermoleophilaceae bacterium]